MQRSQSRKGAAKRSQSKIVHDPTNPSFFAYFPEANNRDVKNWRHERIKSRRSIKYTLPPPANAAPGTAPKVMKGHQTVNYHVVKYDKTDNDIYDFDDNPLKRIKCPNKQCATDVAEKVYDPYVNSNFNQVPNVRPVTHIGHTRPKGTLYGIEDGIPTAYKYDAGFISAPQYYKNEPEYRKFHGTPRQQQLQFAGNSMMPIPCGPRTFYQDESRNIKKLNQSVYCRGFHCDQKDIRNQLESQYWSKHGKKQSEQKGETWTKWAKRMASSFAGGKVGKGVSMWMPKGASKAGSSEMGKGRGGGNGGGRSSFDENLYSQGFSGETMERLRGGKN